MCGQFHMDTGDDHLDLLTARERRHARVRAKLLVQADVFEVFLDVGRRERRVHGASARATFSKIHHLHVLLKPHLASLVA